MDRLLPGAIVIAALLVLLGLMWWGWARRRNRDAGLGAPHPVPENVGEARASTEAFYVATTASGDPLRRVAVRGLGFRARAQISVVDMGIVLEIPGESGIFVPAADIVGLSPATWTIDRVVENDGLLMLAWRLNDTTVDSYFRVTEVAERRALVQAIEDIAPTGSVSATESEEPHGV